MIRHGAALAPPAPTEVARRIEVARSNGWDRRLVAMWRLIDDAIASRDAGALGWEDRLRRLYNVARRRTVEGMVALVVAYLLAATIAVIVVIVVIIVVMIVINDDDLLAFARPVSRIPGPSDVNPL